MRSLAETKYTEGIHKRLVAAARRGLGVKLSCGAAKIAVQTYYNWRTYADEGIEPFRSLFLEVAQARAAHAYMAMEVVQETIADKHNPNRLKAATWALEKVHGIGSGQAQQHVHVHAEASDVRDHVLKRRDEVRALPAEQLDALYDRLLSEGVEDVIDAEGEE